MTGFVCSKGGHQTQQAVRSCVLIFICCSGQKKVFPVRLSAYGHLVRRASEQKKKGEQTDRSEKTDERPIKILERGPCG
jgi:hypothetical protein